MRILLFCEAEADARTARTLIDETLLFRCGAWVRDLFEQDPKHVREWVADTALGREWHDVHNVYAVAAQLGIRRVHGHFDGQRGQAGAIMLATIARIARALNHDENARIDALVVMWDMDKQSNERRDGLEQGAAHVPPDMLFVLGCPNPVRETWVLAGFDAQTELEKQTLDALHGELGFWPHEEPHQLTAANEQAKRSAKRVTKALALTPERELSCLRIEEADRRARFASRGAGCGLEEFLQALEARLVPHVDPGATH